MSVYVPADPVDSVVLAADGGWHTKRLVAALERAGRTSTMVVGVHGMPTDEGRFAEYVPGVDPPRFDAHEAFFLNVVPEWLQARLGVTLRPERTAVWGASLGGEFALAMGVRHPDAFAAVFAASPGGGFRPTGSEADLPAMYLVAGEQEPFFAESAERWHRAACDAGSKVVMQIREGDHGGSFWFEELPLMLTWVFGA